MSGATPELKSTVVRAGAGAGKTHGLIEKVREMYDFFLRTESRAPHLVLTTFTRKATQELKERLIRRACDDRDPGFLQFVSDPTHLHISTIHGLLSVFLHQVGHLAGLDSGFQILSESEAERLVRQALRQVLLEHAEGFEWLEVYGFSRLTAMVRHFDFDLREQGQLCPAGLEDLERLSTETKAKWSRELNALADEVERTISDERWAAFAMELRHANGPDSLPRKPNKSKKQPELDDLHDKISSVLKDYRDQMGAACWNEKYWPRMVEAWTKFEDFAYEFSRTLNAMKDDLGQLEMIDLELKSRQILRDSPFLGAVFAEQWDFWMVDEYQDTSPLQVELLKSLIGEKPYYYVGDPQQSIYLFRGAEVGVFHEAERETENSGGELKWRHRNFRSDPALLEWINEFICSFSPAFTAMQPKDSDERGADDPVRLLPATDENAELAALVTRVSELVKNGARLDQICVLGRTHKHLLEVARALKDSGYPTHVHSSRGFGARREVADGLALWRFLLNPHDNLNLLTLLRSPWFFIADAELAEWMKDRPHSLWRRISNLPTRPEPIERLRTLQIEVSQSGVIQTFERALIDQSLIDLSLHDDPAGRKESNFWKLIAKAEELRRRGGRSLLDLLEDNSEDPDATSAQEPNCINLMTIHGSKGLEFDHVIVPRMGDSPRTSPTPPFQASQNIFSFPIWIEEEAEFIASPLDAETARDRRARELEETDRWLYVALTRAKHTLTLSWSKVENRSWIARANNLQAAVVELQEPPRYQASDKKSSKVRGLWCAPDEHGSSARTSVTEILEKASSSVPKMKDLIARMRAQETGTRVHRRLEALKYRRDFHIPEGDPAVAFVLGLEDPPLARLIEHGHVEWGFQIQTHAGILEGQIDLWAEWDGRLYVIDYKSGSPAYKEKAFRQLSLYAWALRRFGHELPIELIVIYPLSQALERRPFTEQLFLLWEDEFGRT